MEPKTFRGLSLAEVERKVRAELGDDAVVVRQREGLTGGVGGFFQRKLYEVDALPGDGAPAPAPELAAPAPEPMPAPDFADTLKSALEPEVMQTALEQQAAVQAAVQFVADELPSTPAKPAPDPGAAAALAALFAQDKAIVATPEPAPAPVDEPEFEFDFPTAPVAEREPEPVLEPEILPAPRVTPEPVAEVLPERMPSAWPAAAPKLQGTLVARGVSGGLAHSVLDEAVTHLLPFSSNRRLKPLVAAALARRIPVQSLRGAGGRVIGFVGPGGAGKTRCVARLAHAYALKAGVPVHCLALRAEDDGAELQRLVRPFGVPVHAIADAAEARIALAKLPDDALVLVDTPGVSPRADADLRTLAAELRQLRLDECHLALPATMGADQGRELVGGTKALGVDALALTHADETEQLGTAVELAIETELPFSFISRGTIVSGGLRPAMPEELAMAVAA